MGRELAKTWHDAVRIFKVPKKTYDIKIWGRVQVLMWSAINLLLLWCTLPWVVQLVKLLK